jgi:hypothetical protein
VPTARWLPVSYKSDENRLAEAFFESENAIVRVDWKGVPLAYLRVTRDVATFAADIYHRLFIEWLDVGTTTHAALNVDFELYSTYEDALARSKKARWTHCANETYAPFPGGCAPDANSASEYASLRLSAYSPTDHAVFVESPAPVAFGDAFAPPLDSNQAQFTGSNAISAAGDLSLVGADAFTIRTRADLVGSVNANLLDIPGLLSITTSTVATTDNNNFILRFTGLCDLSSPIVAEGTTLQAPAFSGSTEIVVTYDGSYVNLYVDGEQWYSYELNYGEPCANPGVPSLADARWSMGDASNSFDDTGMYFTKGFLSFLTTWSGVALSPQNVKRMSRADYRYVPRPTHHFNFDEGAGSVVRDHFRGVGGADTLRAYFGPTPAYRKAPAAPSLSTFLKADAGDAPVAVAKSKSYAHIYEGSFTMQAWFRADGDLTAGSHQVFGNYDTSSSSVPNFFNLAAQPGTNSGFYGLTLEYKSDGLAHKESVLDGDALEIDRWYHLAVQRDVEAGEARVFVDGVLKLSSTDVGYPALGLDGALVDSDAGLFLGGNSKDAVATKASFSDFQVYSAAVPPTFPTGPGVCSPPSAEFLVLWLPLDRAGDQVDASGRGAAATAPRLLGDGGERAGDRRVHAPAVDALGRSLRPLGRVRRVRGDRAGGVQRVPRLRRLRHRRVRDEGCRRRRHVRRRVHRAHLHAKRDVRSAPRRPGLLGGARRGRRRRRRRGRRRGGRRRRRRRRLRRRGLVDCGLVGRRLRRRRRRRRRRRERRGGRRERRAERLRQPRHRRRRLGGRVGHRRHHRRRRHRRDARRVENGRSHYQLARLRGRRGGVPGVGRFPRVRGRRRRVRVGPDGTRRVLGGQRHRRRRFF